jgi:DNA-binding HxlR family transcriptional regulator
MKRTALGHHPCSIARALDVVGEWWTPLILRDISYGVRRFREIQDDLGISANVLADRLDALVAEGILQTSLYQQRPRRYEYQLTDKGAELLPALLALMQWGDRWTWPAGHGPVHVTHAPCGHEVRVEVQCPACERAVATGELLAEPASAALRPPQPGQPGSISAARLGRGGVRLQTG